MGWIALTAGVWLLVSGPSVGGAQLAAYPSSGAFTASDAPDLWNAAGGGNAVTIALGGTVSFEASTVESHDASFGSTAVACVSGGQPTGARVPATASASWNGTCTFSAPGYHAFVCTLHLGMTGEVAVAGSDGVLAPRMPVVQPPGAEVSPDGGPAPGAGVPSAGAPDAGAPGTPPAALQPVFDIDREQRGAVVRGVIALAGPQATVTVDVSARRRDLARSGATPGGIVALARRTQTTNAAGIATFAVALGPAVRRAVLRRKRLAVTAQVTVRGARISTSGVRRTRIVTLLAPGVRRGALAQATVEVRNDFFLPRNVSIRRRGTVTWGWQSEGRPHNVVVLGVKSPDQSAGSHRRTFTKAGTYRYACSLHDGMNGTVEVR